MRVKWREIQTLHCFKWFTYFFQRLLIPGFHLNENDGVQQERERKSEGNEWEWEGRKIE
jgi:hypothetical protein